MAKLEPNHGYVLSLNGKPKHASNSLFSARYNDDGYLDFTPFPTDPKGSARLDFNTKIQGGNYDVKFFIKDAADGKIVLYNDNLLFTVE